MSCAPQRFLANDRNLLRSAVLTASSVQAVSDSVQSIPTPRKGTAQVSLSGPYSGTEDATYDAEIVDLTVSTELASAPVRSGAGNGLFTAITATGVTAQAFVIELADAGIPTRAAAVDFEGVKITARTPGAAGNTLRITIDQTAGPGLTFATSSFSLLSDAKAGDGSDTTGFEGPAFDWDTAVLGADDIIPSSAHRVAFGDDTSAVYLNYKRFVDNKWTYHLVPTLKSDQPKGTPVKFVTGGRTVEVTDGTTTETYTGIVTVYDLLNALKTTSALVTVIGIVANDRSPTGQAARELLVRTDAHVEKSTGSGSSAATGFVDTFANSGALTELVTATCFAVTPKDFPLAHLGVEYWNLRGSLSGDLGRIKTGQAFTDPGGKFGLTIPVKLPAGYGVQKGRFAVTDIIYAQRETGQEKPPICPVSLSLGPAAVDQSLVLKYTKRPSGDCNCASMPKPNLDTACLGNIDTGGDGVGYAADTRTRLVDLYGWAEGIIAGANSIQDATNVDKNLYGGSVNPNAGEVAVSLAPDKVDSVVGSIAVQDPFVTNPIPGSIAGHSMVKTQQTLTADVLTSGAPAYQFTYTASDGTQVVSPNSAEVYSAINGYGIGIASFSPVPFMSVVSDYESVLGQIDVLPTGSTERSDGCTAWDAAVVSMKALVNAAVAATAPVLSLPTDAMKAYLNKVLVSAGIPAVGKADASTLSSGDGCWHDTGDQFYWDVVGSEGGYAPLFNNTKYWSARKADTDGLYYATHEFALQVNVKCPGLLKEGDEIHASIGDSAWPTTYQVGDLLTLPIIAAQPLYLAGGQDGNDILVWYVTGSVDGPFAAFSYDIGSPTPYSNGGLAFTYTPGGIPNAKGDKVTFSIEGGHYHWRKNGGSWSSALAIPAAPTVLDSGLSIAFTLGASPSFVVGDLWQFRALQPWAVSNVVSPDPDRWQWTGTGQTLAIDFGSAKTIAAGALSRHTLPAGCTITLQGGSTTGVSDWTETFAYQPGVIFKQFTTAHSSRYVKWTFGTAPDASVGWIWLGDPLTTVRSADLTGLRMGYNIQRSTGGLNQSGLFLGRAVSGDLEWQPGALTETDRSNLLDFYDWIKSNDDEPFVFVPQVTRPTEAYLQRALEDALDMPEMWDYNPDVSYQRAFSAKMGLAGVYR